MKLFLRQSTKISTPARKASTQIRNCCSSNGVRTRVSRQSTTPRIPFCHRPNNLFAHHLSFKNNRSPKRHIPGPNSVVRIERLSFPALRSNMCTNNAVRSTGDVTNEWFRVNEELAKERKSSDLYFCFLEGCAGSGKTDIITRLKHIGYTTISIPFLPYFQKLGKDASRIWADDHTNAVLDIFKKKPQVKDKIVFVQRSVLSPFLMESKDKYLDEMVQLENRISSSVVWAHTHPDIADLRLAGREELDFEFREARMLLGERRWLQSKVEMYEKAFSDDLFDDKLDTTSVKQAVVGLLRLYDCEFKSSLRPDITDIPNVK